MAKTVGLIATMSPDDTWPEEFVQHAKATHGLLANMLEQMGFEVLDEGPLHRGYHEMAEAGRALRSRGIGALVIYVSTWTYANCAAAAALEAGAPVVIWADATPDSLGFVGGAIVRGGMAEVGVHANLVYGLFDDAETKSEVKRLLDAACAATSLRGQVMGLAGGRSMGMLTAVCDPSEVRNKFGIEIDCFEQMQVIDRAESMDDAAAMPCLNWMKETFGSFVAKDDVLIRQIKMYLALKDLCTERGYDFVAVKCLPELPSLYTTFCVAHALMGDAQDHLGAKERFVFACEADINAALTMQILKPLSGGPVMFTDLLEFNFDKDCFVMCNCGSQPTDFAKSKKDVCWERESTHEFCWRYGGTSPQHITRPGRVTLARLSRNQGNYEMLIAPAEVIDLPKETIRPFLWERPHSFVKLLCDRSEFVRAVRSNHIHLVYGDWIEELREVCSILDIKPVIINERSSDAKETHDSAMV